MFSDEWRIDEVLTKLQEFWTSNVYPVNMSVLCAQAQNRRCAAMALASLLGK